MFHVAPLVYFHGMFLNLRMSRLYQNPHVCVCALNTFLLRGNGFGDELGQVGDYTATVKLEKAVKERNEP